MRVILNFSLNERIVFGIYSRWLLAVNIYASIADTVVKCSPIHLVINYGFFVNISVSVIGDYFYVKARNHRYEYIKKKEEERERERDSLE